MSAQALLEALLAPRHSAELKLVLRSRSDLADGLAALASSRSRPGSSPFATVGGASSSPSPAASPVDFDSFGGDSFAVARAGTPGASSANAGNGAELLRVRSMRDALQTKTKSLMAAVKRLEKQLADKAAANAALTKRVAGLEAQVAASKERAVGLAEDKAGLEAQVKSLQEAAVAAAAAEAAAVGKGEASVVVVGEDVAEVAAAAVEQRVQTLHETQRTILSAVLHS